MDQITKPWGLRQRIHETPTFVLDRLILDVGGYCTVHYHEQKYNKFWIEQGFVNIEFFLPNKDRPLLSSTAKLASNGDYERELVVKPLVVHRFRNVHAFPSILYEMIYTQVCEEDIIRLTKEGGCT